MDPTAQLCRVRNTFNTTVPEIELPPYFSLNTDRPSLLLDITTASITDVPNLEPIYIDKTLYTRLQNIKNGYGVPEFGRARIITNPFEGIGKSIFMDRAGVKLANIDAVLNLTGQNGGLMSKQVMGEFRFCDLAGAPGAWTQYIQWRRPESYGYGISLRGDIEWNSELLDMDRFNITYGQDETGNLYTNANWFGDYVRSVESEGVDLVMADGGFSVDGQEDRQEYLTSHLILSETLTALQCLKIGGSYVFKVYDTVTKFTGDLLYVLACCFDQIWIFKPISSRPANSEQYVICKGLKVNIDEYVAILGQAYGRYQTPILSEELMTNTVTPQIMVTSLLQNIPENFKQWLMDMNTLSITRQIQIGENILTLLNGGNVEIPAYNLYKCLALWNLPDNPESERRPSKRDPEDTKIPRGYPRDKRLLGQSTVMYTEEERVS